MHAKPVTGIPNLDISGRWLVPPWPEHAGVSEVVRHFLRFHVHGDNTAHLLAYYQGYAAALAAASKRDLTRPVDWQWYGDLRDCVSRCVVAYQKKVQAEAETKSNVRQLLPDAAIPMSIHRESLVVTNV